MKFKDNGIFDLATWKAIAPPFGGNKQWKEGRSAMELARYMTADYPNVPPKMEGALSNISVSSSDFEWRAEYVTEFEKFGLGKGEGRNHDAFLFNAEMVVGIEAKADEPLGSDLLGEAIKKASKNKLHRINTMTHMLFGDDPQQHTNIRYQLLTATTAVLLEAKERNVQKAVLMVIIFKKQGCYSEIKIQKNNTDILNFITETQGKPCGDCYIIPTSFGDKNGIDLYFYHFEIIVE